MGAAQREEREPPAPRGSQFALLGGGNAGRVALGSAGSGRRGSSRHMTASFLCLPAFSPSAFFLPRASYSFSPFPSVYL